MRLDRSHRRQTGFGPTTTSLVALLATAAMVSLVLWKLFRATG